MKPFALMVKLGEIGSLSNESTSEHLHGRTVSRRFSVQRQLSRAGTLDGLVVISNSFLAQCPQKPTSSAPTSRFNLRKISRTSSPRRLDIVDGLLRFGAALV